MKEYNILLCCGAGMSSGFLAQQMRNAAKKAKIIATIQAKSQNDIEEILAEVNILLIGPHLAYAKEDLEEKCAPYHIPVEIIPEKIYGSLNGAELLKMTMAILKKEEA